MNKKLYIPAVAIVLGGTALFGITRLAHAQTSTNPFGNLAQAIASKFNLNKTDVQNFLTTYRQTNAQDMRKKHYDQLVSEGKITADQEKAILAELDSIKGQHTPESMKGMTQAQRQQAMQTEKDTLTTWAKSQGIDPQYVMPIGGMHRGGERKSKPTGNPTP